MSNITTQELTTEDAKLAADALIVAGLKGITERPNVLARHVRDWMSANVSGTLTDRQEFQEAVLHVLEARFDEEFGPRPAPPVKFGAFR